MKLAELVLHDYRLLYILSRFGIRLGFGEKSVDDVCRRYGIPTSLFLLICNVYSFEDYHPDEAEIEAIDPKALVDYLTQSHRDYLDNHIPHIGRHIERLGESGAEATATILTRFYEDYRTEVVRHLDYEEQTVFPYILQLTQGGGNRPGYTIDQFEENHSNIEEKLGDLKNILIKYLPEEYPAEPRNRTLLDLYLLESDLNKHTLIEEKILVPLVVRLERERL